jgi:poly [ADP-ribose] polymerase
MYIHYKEFLMGASLKVKAFKTDEAGQPNFPASYKVTKRWEGNCSELAKNSNKFYHAEIQVASNGQARIFTTYGRVGSDGAKEYRYYPSESSCLSDFESLVSKKRDRKKDPYREIDLAITSVGSEGAKAITKPMTGIASTVIEQKSKLHREVQRLVKKWFGDTGHFVEMNLKCPLGQLSVEQIDKGRVVLDECRDHINSKHTTNTTEWDRLTSQFYSLIPHVLPHKIDVSVLRLHTLDRIMEKSQTLDTFLDAKNVASVLAKGASTDAQYTKLRAHMEWIDPADPARQWVEKLVHETRSKNHSGLGRVKVFNVFRLIRDGEPDNFTVSLDRIAKDVKGKGEKPKFTTLERPDLDKDERQTFLAANVWPLWHGTRPQNMVGIISRGLLIRPSGAVYTGSMFGDGLYHAESSSKSMNYTGCNGSCWSGSSGEDKAYLFLEDVIVGNPHIVYSSQFFREPPRGTHSVYAIPGRGLYNSENITYVQSGPGQQHRLRYIVEFQSNQ